MTAKKIVVDSPFLLCQNNNVGMKRKTAKKCHGPGPSLRTNARFARTKMAGIGSRAFLYFMLAPKVFMALDHLHALQKMSEELERFNVALDKLAAKLKSDRAPEAPAITGREFSTTIVDDPVIKDYQREYNRLVVKNYNRLSRVLKKESHGRNPHHR